jgi:hypothetical protein
VTRVGRLLLPSLQDFREGMAFPAGPWDIWEERPAFQAEASRVHHYQSNSWHLNEKRQLQTICETKNTEIKM